MDSLLPLLPDLKPFGPKYYDEFRDEFSRIDKSSKILPCFDKLSEKYTIIPSMWYIWYRNEKLIKRVKVDDKKSLTSLQKMSFPSIEYDNLISTDTDSPLPFYKIKKNLYMDYYDFQLKHIFKNVYSLKECVLDIKCLEDRLGYPHIGMEKLFDAYMIYANASHSTSPLKVSVIKQYKTALNLLETLKVIERNVELWIKYLAETEDSEFIINSCEYRLGKNPADKEFWLAYLKYLKDNNYLKELLETYSRYCRLFLNDNQMLEKYYQEICESELKRRFKWWEDYILLIQMLKGKTEESNIQMRRILVKFYSVPIDWDMPKDDFEKNYAKFLYEIKAKEPYAESTNNDKNNPQSSSTSVEQQQMSDITSNLRKYFASFMLPTEDNPTLPSEVRQLFSVPKQTLDHILTTASPQLWLKLQMSCKYFLLKNDAIYCHRFVVREYEGTEFFGNSFTTDVTQLRNANLQKYNIANSLEILVSRLHFVETLRIDRILSYIVSKVEYCNIRFLIIEFQYFTFKELEFLTSAGTLEHVEMMHVGIQNGVNYATMEDVIGLLPNVTYLFIDIHFVYRQYNYFGIKYTPETAQKLAGLTRNKKFKFFTINRMTQDLDPDSFAAFIKNNAAQDAEFRLLWNQEVVGAPFKQNFESTVRNLVYAGEEFDNTKLKILFAKQVVAFH